MIQFKDVTLEDKEVIQSFTLKSNRRNCDLSFSNICSWRFLYHTKFAVVEDFLVLRFRAEGKLAYMTLIGEGNYRPVVEKLVEDAAQAQEPFCMLGVCSNICEELKELMPDKFVYTIDRDYADYIYLRNDLATLTGKKYQSKRNHINKFRKLYNYEYQPITPDLIPECLRLEDEWCRANSCQEEKGLCQERQALLFALNHFEKLGLTGGVLRVEGKIVAFTFGMPINQETFGIHVEKADTSINGAYAMINYEFANHIPEQYIYLNREEDLGIEGLRKAKLSYNPVTILEKYMVCLKEETYE
ncbi:MAG: DUF2156 domain-containing protein [Bacteroides sp.]|nr:DUF2156 domain-containing protein [Bacteroides sp.]